MKRKLKNFMSVLLVLLLVFGSAPVLGDVISNDELSLGVSSRAAGELSGECGKDGADVRWSFDESTGTLTISGEGEMEDYFENEIPWNSMSDSIKKLALSSKVKSIGSNAFKGTKITDIVIPGSIRRVGIGAFADCTELKTVTLQYGVVRLRSRAFYNCSSLTDIHISDSVTSIGDDVFNGCVSLSEITIPESVVLITNRAFKNCSSLKNVIIPKKTQILGFEAFADCTSLESVSIPNTYVEENCFANCINLKNIQIDNHIKMLNRNSFDNTAYYYTPSKWKNGGLYIGNHLICVKDTVSGTFEVKSGTTSIAREAFKNCTAIDNIIIPDSVVNIGMDAFVDTAFYDDDNNWSDGVLYIGSKLIKAKENITGEYKIKDGTTAIGDCAFVGCLEIENIILPDTVYSIGYGSFGYCGIKDFVMPDSVTMINQLVFGSSLIENVTLSKNIETIPYGMFAGCENLKRLEIPEGVKDIEHRIFEDSENLVEIYIPKSIENVSASSFVWCENLKDVYYSGTEEEWDKINFYDIFGYEDMYYDYLLSADIHFAPHVHEFTNYISNGNATCTANGTETAACNNGCGLTDTREAQDSKLPHTFTVWTVTKNPTCTEVGLKVNSCSVCGAESGKTETVSALGHTDGNSDGNCDRCGTNLNPVTPDDPSAGCDCGCHKSGFANLIFKFILIFQKLFRMNKTCSCGKAHY